MSFVAVMEVPNITPYFLKFSQALSIALKTPLPLLQSVSSSNPSTDIAGVAFPSSDNEATIADSDEKALYYRPPYSSREGVIQYFPEPALQAESFNGNKSGIPTKDIIDITKYMAEDGHLLAAWRGDHDSFAYDRHNTYTLYQDFWERFNAHLLDGVSYVNIGLNDGKQIVHYPIIGSHRHKGFSVYNDAHASWRQQLDEANTSHNIISITAHKHTKAFLQQTRKVFGGDERLIYSLSLGTYKRSDRYSRKHGWPRKGKETASAFGIILFPSQDRVQVFWNLKGAIEFYKRLI